MTGENAAAAFLALDLEPRIVALQGVLDDRKTESGAPELAGAAGIHFYALNRWPATRAILAALQAARPWEDRPTEPAAATAS